MRPGRSGRSTSRRDGIGDPTPRPNQGELDGNSRHRPRPRRGRQLRDQLPGLPGLRLGWRDTRRSGGARARDAGVPRRRQVEDGDSLPPIRTLEELRADKDYRADAKGAVVVAVPFELPGKSVRLNISLDKRLVEAIDRAVQVRECPCSRMACPNGRTLDRCERAAGRLFGQRSPGAAHGRGRSSIDRQ